MSTSAKAVAVYQALEPRVFESLGDHLTGEKFNALALVIYAFQFCHNQPYARRAVTFAQIRELALALRLDHPQLTPEHLWDAYEQLERSVIPTTNDAGQGGPGQARVRGNTGPGMHNQTESGHARVVPP